MFDKIIDNISSAANTAESDYKGNDGLKYCGKCHTPKQVRITILGEERTPYCMCDCERAKRDAEDNAHRQYMRQREIERLRDMAFPDSRDNGQDMKQWTFANDNGSNPKIAQVAKKYAENFAKFREQGRGLMLYGSVGTGKSYIAACIANVLLDEGYSVLMTNFARIRNEVQGTFNKQEYYDNLNSNDLLIIDDLATESKTEYMQEIVFNVIDLRSRVNLPLIVTTNLTSQEIKNPADIGNQRIFSRIVGMCYPIKFEGDDQRRKKAVSAFAEMKKQLGL